LLQDLTEGRASLIARLVGALALGLPHGFAVTMIVGTVMHYAARRFGLLVVGSHPVEEINVQK
jgi:hypothetical protein